MMAAGQKKSLGESLVSEGIITAEQLKQAQAEEKRTGLRLRNVLVKMGLIAEEDLVTFLSDKLSMPRIELANYIIDSKIIDLVPEALARKYELIPVLKIGNRVTCAMTDPWNIFALDEIRAKTGFIVEPAVATQTEIKKALNEHYGVKGTMEDVLKTLEEKKLGLKPGKEVDVKELEEVIKEPVVIKLVNLMIMDAVRQAASDIHIEPEEEALKTRFRVDGVLHEVSSPPKYLQSAVTSRIKIMASLDISERRVPQDGRFNIKVENRSIDVRVSCVPTIFGENVVLRLLDVASALLGLARIGFSKETLEKYEKIIMRPHGIILVTGPTGSGKTTTLYASLDKINTAERNIITVEDPVEYKLAGIRQIQVNPKVGLTFANGLRSILRQDPDIIMVGEMRDTETAEIAIQSALTGHLVFSTLHTNDAPGAVTRMADMKIEPFLISSSVIGVLAQRLVRLICGDCKEKYEPTGDTLKDIESLDIKGPPAAGIRKAALYRGKGCPKCGNTGYKGRIGIFELMAMDEKIRDAILRKASADEMRNLARSAGMTTMLEDGFEKVKAGLTTIDEVMRVTREG